MKKLKIIELFIIIVIGLFACSKKNEQQQNINTENLQQSQEQEEIGIDEQLKKQFEAEKSNTVGDPVYIFKPEKYNILESSVNIRSQPNLTSSVIGKLKLHSEIEIIERAENFQTIDDMTHYWYKIKYEDITGYIWGGFISIETKIFVIDNNTNMYCYYRVSKLVRNELDYNRYSYGHLITPNDIFIYINQKRSKTNVIEEIYSEEYYIWPPQKNKYFIRDYWYYCSFREEDGNISFKLTDRNIAFSIFFINKHGEITHDESFIASEDW